MLRWLVGIEEVGIYSVAVRLSEVWYVLPAVLVSSLYPRLIKLYAGDVMHFRQRLQQVFDLLSSLAIVIAVLVAVVAQPLIDFLFGINYSESAPILSLHIWAAVFIFMRAALSKWILITDMLVFSMVTQGLGALVNDVAKLLSDSAVWWRRCCVGDFIVLCYGVLRCASSEF